MKSIILYLAVLGCTLAAPEGYYHQEYNYKSSSKAYKNNELQHSTDDQGYYRKDGDLEGREKPIVDANSEHSEYVNPNIRNSQYGNGYGDSLTSHGVMNAQEGYGSGRYSTNDLRADGMASSDHIAGSRAYSTDYASGSYGSRYGSSNYGTASYGSGTYGNSYGSSSNIRSVVEDLRRELESDVQSQIRQHNAYSSSRLDLSQLEQDVSRRLNEKLRNELNTRYGQQTIRNGMSYTIENGQIQPTANYNEQEYQNLKTDLENSLLSQLRNGYNQRYDSHYEESHRYNYGYTSTVRPTTYHHIYPSLPYYSTTPRPIHQTNYAPVSNPESITNIATRIQSDLDTSLNQLLDDVYRQHFSSRQQYQLSNTDVILRRMEEQLRSNITSMIDYEIRKNYGTQTQKDGYWYSVGPQGQISNNYNYAARDLDALKAQVERNLLRKLTENFATYKAKWSQSSSVIYDNNNYNTYSTTPRYYYSTTPNYYSTPAISSIKGGSSSSNYYYSGSSGSTGYSGTAGSSGYTGSAGSSGYTGSAGSNGYSGTSDYEATYGSSSSSTRLAQLQRQMQNDLSNQLQNALHKSYSQYSNSGGSNSQAYQNSLHDLTDELNRNLTRKFQEYSASGSYSAYGHFDRAEMDRLQNQLQNDLTRELQQNLQNQYYSSSSSYSASSSSSNSGSAGHYRPIRGFQNNQLGQYGAASTLMIGEDCDHDEPNNYRNYRMKRSYGTYGRQNQQPQNGRLESFHYQEEVGQKVDDSDLTQQLEDADYGNLRGNYRGQISYSEHIGQEVRPSSTHGELHAVNQYHHQIGQELDDTELTQQIEDAEYGNLQNSVRVQANSYRGHAGQEVRPSNYGRPQAANQHYHQVGQEIDDSDLTQKVEDLRPQSINHRVVPSSNREVSSGNNYGSNINSQESSVRNELKNKIEQELSQELKEIKKKFDELQQSSHTLSQEYFEEIKINLQQNISQKLQEINSHNKKYGLTYYNIPLEDNNYVSKLEDEIMKDLLQDFQQGNNYNSYQSWQSSGSYSHSSASQNRRTFFQPTQNIPTPGQSYSHSTTELLPQTEENSNYGKLNKRQMRFVQYVKDKLYKDLTEAVEYVNNNGDNISIKEKLTADVEKNITNAFNSYSEYFLNEYMDLNQQQIVTIKKQLLVDCTQQLNHILKTQNPSSLNSQVTNVYSGQTVLNQPKRVYGNTEFVGQTVDEDENTQVLENSFGSSRIPSANQELKPQPPKVYSDHGLAQPSRGYPNTEFVGQTVDDEDENTQKIENPFGSSSSQQQQSGRGYYNTEFVGQTVDKDENTLDNSFGSSRIPSANQQLKPQQPPKIQSQPGRVFDNPEFVGQTVDDEDDNTQKLENPFGVSSNRQQPSRGYHNTGFAGQTEEKDENTQILENSFGSSRIPSANQELRPQQSRQPGRVFDNSEFVGQTVDDEDENTQKLENPFGTSSNQQQPSRGYHNNEFIGQTVDEDNNTQVLENSFGSSRIPSANQELKPQSPKIYSDHGLAQQPSRGYHNTELVGQTVDDENTQVLETSFGSSSRIPSANQQLRPQQSRQPGRVFDNSEFVGQTVDDEVENTQKLENPFGSSSSQQQPGRGYQNTEFVGQTVDEEDNTQVLENSFGSSRIPSANQELKPQPPKIYSDHGLAQQPSRGYHNTEFVGQTVEDENTQILENSFGSSSRIPSANQELKPHDIQEQKPQPTLVNAEFVGQTVDEEDENGNTQKLENPFEPKPSRVIDNNEFVGQTVDEDENVQKLENPSIKPQEHINEQYSDHLSHNNEFVGQTVDNGDDETLRTGPNKPQHTVGVYEDLQEIEDGFDHHETLQSNIRPDNQFIGLSSTVKPQTDIHQQSNINQFQSGTIHNTVQHNQQDITERPSRKPQNVNSNNFLQTEIDHQESINQLPNTNDLELERNPLNQNSQTTSQSNPVNPNRETGIGSSSYDINYQSRQEAENNADSLIEALRRAQSSRNQGNSYQTQHYGSYGRNSGYPNQYDYNPYNVRITEQNSYSHGSSSLGQTGRHTYTPYNAHVQETYSYGSSNLDNTRGNSYSPYNSQINEQNSYSPSLDLRGRTPGSSSYNAHVIEQNSYSHPHTSAPVQKYNVNKLSSSNSYSHSLHYGTQETLDENLESSSNLEPIEPLQTQRAYLTHQAPNSYAGVKGHGRRLIPNQETGDNFQSSTDSSKPFPPSEEPGIDESNREETTPVNTEELPWWKRFGSKVSQGAKNLKEKIVG